MYNVRDVCSSSFYFQAVRPCQIPELLLSFSLTLLIMMFHLFCFSAKVRELFKYIGRYTAHTIELDTKLKPFMPDYIPCVGGIDEFIKVPRPDGKPDYLGLKVILERACWEPAG